LEKLPEPALLPASAASSAYRAPAWLPGGHLQTLCPSLFTPRAHIRYRRERWDTPDSDFVDLDWMLSLGTDASIRESAGAPLVALFHGLEGSSRSHYATALMGALQDIGWRGVVIHFRGCSGEINRLRRAYHSGDSAEIDWILRRLHESDRQTQLYAAGISLGGNALLKWLGEQGAAANDVISAAAAVSAPVDLMAAGNALDSGFNLIYTRNFLRTMKRKTLAKLERYPDLCDRRLMLASHTLREFDDVVTAPLHGYRNTDDYWTRASSKPLLRDIATPTLVINAKNDPFLPALALPLSREVSNAVRLELPDAGGHVGFTSGPFPGHINWLPRRIVHFFRQSHARG
jgi:predicted alpha/beta-fold hydrolase